MIGSLLDSAAMTPRTTFVFGTLFGIILGMVLILIALLIVTW